MKRKTWCKPDEEREEKARLVCTSFFSSSMYQLAERQVTSQPTPHTDVQTALPGCIYNCHHPISSVKVVQVRKQNGSADVSCPTALKACATVLCHGICVQRSSFWSIWWDVERDHVVLAAAFLSSSICSLRQAVPIEKVTECQKNTPHVLWERVYSSSNE